MQLDPARYKEVLAQWATGVTVVTTLHPSGARRGITATSFASVSLDPPLVLVCVGKELDTHAAIAGSGVFAVNFLQDDQAEWGLLFAGLVPEAKDRFAGIECTVGVTGSPLLPGTLGWLDCRVWATYDGGDHTIYVGEVLAGDRVQDGAPLLYHNRRWGAFTPATG